MTQPAKSARLGRGLSALLGDYQVARNPGDGSPIEPGMTGATDGGAPTTELPIAQVIANPKQPRRTFVESDLEELTESIRVKGVLQAILVRPSPDAPGSYEIVAGERRWRAARRAGLTSIPAMVRDLDDRDVLEIGIVENVQRSDLNAIEEAEAYKALIDRFGRTQESVAGQVNKSREHVANTLRLLNLPEDVREHVREGRLSAGHARALLKTQDPSQLATVVISKSLSVRDTEGLAKQDKVGGASSKPAAEDKDVDTKALELDLQRALGLDVDIRHANGKGGEVRIKYARLEQLDEICRLLTRPRMSGPAGES